MRKINTIPPVHTNSTYNQEDCLTVSIDDCAYLTEQFSRYGVEEYRLFRYEGSGYVTRYMTHRLEFLPCWEYKDGYIVPLLFRDMPDTKKMFEEAFRWPAFFKLLDWYLAYRPEKALIPVHGPLQDRRVVDTAYLIFRLSEICDGAAFPIGHLNNLSEFEQWNQIFHLIDTGKYFRRRKDFDPTQLDDLTQLEVVIAIIKMRYQQEGYS
ncbi:hypothetical protein [Enterococcus florum]|nr:hypothetical protein [Enterococcus florum]